jgi:hypothetical protein
MTTAHILEKGLHFGTDRYAKPASGVETASGGRIDRARHVSFQDDPGTLSRGVGDRNGTEERFSIRVQGAFVDSFLVPDLHNLSQVHDSHTIGDMLHHGEVVRYEQVRKAVLLLQVFQKIQNLRPNGNVQS